VRLNPHLTYCLTVGNNLIAAATENKDYSKDYNPGAIIIKEMAEAVVIHICSSKVSFERLLISIVCNGRFCVTYFLCYRQRNLISHLSIDFSSHKW